MALTEMEHDNLTRHTVENLQPRAGTYAASDRAWYTAKRLDNMTAVDSLPGCHRAVTALIEAHDERTRTPTAASRHALAVAAEAFVDTASTPDATEVFQAVADAITNAPGR